MFVSRELKPEDISQFKEKFGYDPASIPIMGGTYRHFGFLDAMAFIVHPDNPINQLDFKQLDAAFSSTLARGGNPVKTWGDLGLTGEWADKPVHLYGIKPWNGFEEFIRQRVLSVNGKRGEWRSDIKFSKVVFPVAKDVAEDKYGLGYDGLAYLDQPVKVLAVGKSADGKFYSPSYENVAMADYPLSRLVFFNFNKHPDKPIDPALAEFIRFMLSADGQQLVRDQAIYMPLRAKQAETSNAMLSK